MSLLPPRLLCAPSSNRNMAQDSGDQVGPRTLVGRAEIVDRATLTIRRGHSFTSDPPEHHQTPPCKTFVRPPDHARAHRPRCLGIHFPPVELHSSPRRPRQRSTMEGAPRRRGPNSARNISSPPRPVRCGIPDPCRRAPFFWHASCTL